MSKVLDILKSVDAFINDSHFVFTSGKHSAIYINKSVLYIHTKQTSEVCKLFAETVKDLNIEVVIGPALGGIVLSQWTAHHLSNMTGHEVLAVFTEKTAENDQKFNREYDKVVKGKRAIVVEDLTTTGASAKKTLIAAQTAGAEVLGVCAMVNRNPKEVTSEYFGVPFFPLDTFEIPAYDPADCPMCKSAVPINTAVGHGKKFLQEQAAAAGKN